MKKIMLFTVITTLALLLCSCAISVSVSEMAIVKAIFIDETNDGKVHVSIVVSENAPSSGTQDIQSTATIYEGEATTLEQAINDAENKQSAQPFYELNRLLIIGEGAYNNISSHLAYFKTQEASGVNLSVFLTELSHDSFSDIQSNALEFIDVCESFINNNAQNRNKSRQILQLQFNEENKFNGYLPLLKTKNNEVISIEQLVVFSDGTPQLTLSNLAVEMMLLLSGELNKLDIELEYNNETLHLKTQNISRQFITSKAGDLQVIFSAKAHSASQNGKELYLNELQNALNFTNNELSEICKDIINATTNSNNDFINLNWYTLQREHVYLKNVDIKVNINA